MTLELLALSRSTGSRAAHRRDDPELLDRLFADPDTRVVLLAGERTPVLDTGEGARLAVLPPGDLAGLPGVPVVRDPSACRDPSDAPALSGSDDPSGGSVGADADADGAGADGAGADGEEAILAFLGEDPTGRSHLLVAVGAVAEAKAVELSEGCRWAGLRTVGGLLDDTGAGLLTAAVGLANWHARSGWCPRCGGRTRPVSAGWARRCTACRAEHYPRTDPAVIMAVVDPADRILLAHQASWPERRVSVLAGFVEPGESLEAAVRREVHEEAGVEVGEVTYLGNQPWPFPSSLMLAFHARAGDGEPRADGVELSEARWWSRDELAPATAAGELLLPPPVSIARRLVEHWFGGPVPDTGEGWR